MVTKYAIINFGYKKFFSKEFSIGILKPLIIFIPSIIPTAGCILPGVHGLFFSVKDSRISLLRIVCFASPKPQG